MPRYKTQHYILMRVDKKLANLVGEFKGNGTINMSWREASLKLANNYENMTAVLRQNKKLLCFTIVSSFSFGLLYMIYSAVMML